MNAGGFKVKVEMDTEIQEVLLDEIRLYIEERLKKDSQQVDYRFLKKKELSKLFNVSTQTIEKWMGMGLEYRQIGNVIIFNVKEVMEWLENYKMGGE